MAEALETDLRKVGISNGLCTFGRGGSGNYNRQRKRQRQMTTCMSCLVSRHAMRPPSMTWSGVIKVEERARALLMFGFRRATMQKRRVKLRVFVRSCRVVFSISLSSRVVF